MTFDRNLDTFIDSRNQLSMYEGKGSMLALTGLCRKFWKP